MAKQAGIIKLKGTIGGVSFYKSQDGYLAREKGGVDKERIRTDPAFQRTRENGAEFGRAGRAVKFVTTAFRPVLQNAADGRVVSRLITSMVKVLRMDTNNDRGLRVVLDENLSLLAGFEFNNRSKLGSTLYAPYTVAIDRVVGEVEISIPAFIPQNLIAAPAGTTHFSIKAVACEMDFVDEGFVQDARGTAGLPYSATAAAATTITCSLTPNTTKPIFLTIAVQFFQEVNGTLYPLKNGSYNAVALTNIDLVP